MARSTKWLLLEARRIQYTVSKSFIRAARLLFSCLSDAEYHVRRPIICTHYGFIESSTTLNEGLHWCGLGEELCQSSLSLIQPLIFNDHELRLAYLHSERWWCQQLGSGTVMAFEQNRAPYDPLWGFFQGRIATFNVFQFNEAAKQLFSPFWTSTKFYKSEV